MSFYASTIRNFRKMGNEHGIVIVTGTLLHLLTNAAFTALAVFVVRTMFVSPGQDVRAFALICNAPLTASMAVLITTIALDREPHHKVIDRNFFFNWLAVTALFGWANSYAWFTSQELSWRFAPMVIHYPPLTDWLDLEGLVRQMPLIISISISTIATLSVPIIVMRLQPFRGHFLKVLALIAACIVFFLALDGLYRGFIDDLEIYRNWLRFPGYTPRALAYDQLIVDLIALPVSLPAWIVTTLVTAAAMRTAIERRTQTRSRPAA